MKLHFDKARSWLMCPALNEPMLLKASGRGADVVVVDLEDGIPPEGKDQARAIAARTVASNEGNYVVRINDPATGPPGLALDDVRGVLSPGLKGIMVPKVESPDTLRQVFDVIGQYKGGLFPGFEVIPLIETPAGVEALDSICAVGRPWLARVAFGAGDYTASLGVEWSHKPDQLLYPRSRIASVSSARGLSAPIDTGSPILDDRETFVADGAQAKLLGFKAKFCINPRQIEWVHSLFMPTQAEIDRALKIVEAYERVEREGKGERITVAQGWMIDLPIVKHSYSLLQRTGLR